MRASAPATIALLLTLGALGCEGPVEPPAAVPPPAFGKAGGVGKAKSIFTPAQQRAIRRRMQRVIDELQGQFGFVGATAAAMLPNGDVVSVATGHADRDAGVPMTPDARVLLGSAAEPFVAAAVLTLVDDGALELDATVSDFFLPDPGDPLRDLPHAGEITVLQLIDFSSGVTNYLFTPIGIPSILAAGPDHDWSPEELLALATPFPARDLPGATKSGTGAVTEAAILDLIVQRVTGDDLGRLVEDRVAGPLGLTDTFRPRGRAVPGLTQNYQRQFPFLPEALIDASGQLAYHPSITKYELVSTAADMSRFFHALMRGELLSPSSTSVVRDVRSLPPAASILTGAGVQFCPLVGPTQWCGPDRVPGYKRFDTYFSQTTEIGFANHISHQDTGYYGQPLTVVLSINSTFGAPRFLMGVELRAAVAPEDPDHPGIGAGVSASVRGSCAEADAFGSGVAEGCGPGT